VQPNTPMSCPVTAATLQLEGIVHTRAHAQSATGTPRVNPHCTDRGASAFTCPVTAATTQQYDGRPDQAVLEPLRMAMTIMERPPHTTTHHDTQLQTVKWPVEGTGGAHAGGPG
jgi:hypothetical protein